MSNTIQANAANSIRDLTNSVMRQVDVNGDGQLSADEFGSFLSSFLQSIGGRGVAGEVTHASVPTTTSFTSTAASANGGRGATPLPPVMPGWNQEKWVNPTHTTIKYVAGRIMARYDPSEWVNPATREQILADFRAAGLTPTASGKDKVDFNDGAGAIDIVQGAGIGGKAWQWLPAGT